MIINISNTLSISRLPLGIILLFCAKPYRFWVIFLALVTDVMDGWIARKTNRVSQFGAMIDPLMDKCFMLCAVILYAMEGYLMPYQILALLSRDISVFIFGCYLFLNGELKDWRFRSIITGKISTSMQFIVFLSISLNIGLAYLDGLFPLFFILGFFALIELAFSYRKEFKDRACSDAT